MSNNRPELLGDVIIRVMDTLNSRRKNICDFFDDFDDFIDDGDVPYKIVTAPATSADLTYDGLNAVDVSVMNIDDDEATTIIYLPLVPND